MLTILPPRFAEREEMTLFHSKEYIAFIEKIVNKYARRRDSADTDANYYGLVDEVTPLTADEERRKDEFGLTDDCPIIPELWQIMRATVGGTLKAIECMQAAHTAHPHAAITSMHWAGGRHHAEAACAKGFCMCNDIVIGILQLLSSSSSYPRILYLDIDLHHGDGVEDAFAASPSVMTCSFHHHSPGFFPGTGAMDTGNDRSKERRGRRESGGEGGRERESRT